MMAGENMPMITVRTIPREQQRDHYAFRLSGNGCNGPEEQASRSQACQQHDQSLGLAKRRGQACRHHLRAAQALLQFVKTSLEQRQRSFGVECRDGIEAHRAQRRDVTGGDGDGGEHGGYAGEGGQIVGRDAVQQAGH
jgi:hypothetical protein